LSASLDAALTAPRALGAPVARLRIPRIELDEIVVEGVGDRELNAGPGHLPGSVLPGDHGNAIISAHRDRHFHGLDRLAVGDTVYTETVQGARAWIIADRRVLDREAPALFAASTPVLTLTTCWPVRYFGPAPDRLLLVATPIG
jgi:sortase A